jgi:hypothetical protein
MPTDGPGLLERAARKHLPNRFRHSHREILILFIAICLSQFASNSTLICVGRTLLFGSLQSRFLNQNTLTFVSLA